jgi:transcriptional regulator with XRE-family HTH domain
MTTIARKRFGRRIARMRHRAQLTQKDVGKQLGYSTAQFISNWERGISFPPDAKLPKLAKVLKTDRRTLVEYTFAARFADLIKARKDALTDD